MANTINVNKTHCLLGHPFDEMNTYIRTRKNGLMERECRTCSNRRTRAARPWKAQGRPKFTRPMTEQELPPETDFWARVRKGDTEECWPWQLRLNRNGYGGTWRGFGPHRLAYRFAVGEIPDGLELDHLCHNRDGICPGGPRCPHRHCVNPNHLEPVTAAENLRRARLRGS